MTVIALDIYPATDPNGTMLVSLTDEDVSEFEMREGENSLGSGTFTIRRDHPDATEANLATGNYVKVRIPLIDSDPIFGFWLDEHDDTILSVNEEGAEVLTRQGPGTLAILGRARFLDDLHAPAPPASVYRGTQEQIPGYWRWRHQPYGAILKRFIEEGQNQPGEPLADVTVDFDRDDDSDGTPWPDIVRDVRFPIGTDGLELLSAFAQTGELYVRSTPDLLISGHQARGTNRTSGSFGAGKVRLVKGVNVQTDLSRSGEGIKAATHAIVIGSDLAYRQVVSPSYTTGTGRWITVNYEESNDDDVLDKVGLEELARGDAEQQALTMEFLAGNDEANGRYLPYVHFRTGDLITLHTGTDAWDYDNAAQRVTGFTIKLRDTSDDSTDELEARSLIFGIELGGSPVGGGFGDLSVSAHAIGDDPFFVDDGTTDIPETRHQMRMRDVGGRGYETIAAALGTDTHDAWLDLNADSGAANFSLHSFNTADPSSEEIVGNNGEISMTVDPGPWSVNVLGTAWDSKHYFDGGWGVVLPILSADPSTSGGATSPSEKAQIYYNDVSDTIRWYDGASWTDIGTGGGGGSSPFVADTLFGDDGARFDGTGVYIGAWQNDPADRDATIFWKADVGAVQIDIFAYDNDAAGNYGQVFLDATNGKVVVDSTFGMVVPAKSSEPGSGDSQDGQFYYNTVTDKFRGRVNGNWVDLQGLAGTAQTYTASNVTTDRSFNANSTTIDELADVLGTLIADLRNRGIVL